MANRFPRTAATLCIGLGVSFGCGSDADDPNMLETPSSGGVLAVELPYEPCLDETLVGEFRIQLAEEFTSVDGKVFDGVTPSLVPVQRATEGECQLLAPPNFLCEPGCAASTQDCGQGIYLVLIVV